MSEKYQPTLKSTKNSEPANQPIPDPRGEFLIAATNMSWQLALVVLVPLIIGSTADKHFHSSPLWTLVGLALAIAGMCLVVWKQFQVLSPKIISNHSSKGGKL